MKVPTETPDLSLIETLEPSGGIVKENSCSNPLYIDRTEIISPTFHPFEKETVSPKLNIILPSEAVLSVLDWSVFSFLQVRLRLAVAVSAILTVNPISRGEDTMIHLYLLYFPSFAFLTKVNKVFIACIFLPAFQ